MKEQQLIEKALLGNKDAVEFCTMLFSASQVLDDLIDGDKQMQAESVIVSWWNMLIDIPQNPFYRAHEHDLRPLIRRSLTDWLAANELEHGDDHEKSVAFVLRDSVSMILIECAYLVGGYSHARAVNAPIVKQIYNESLEAYKAALGGEIVEPSARLNTLEEDGFSEKEEMICEQLEGEDS